MCFTSLSTVEPDLLARAVAGLIEPDELEAAEEALDEAVTVIEHFDPALVRSAVPNLLLAREAVKHVKVVLTGEGADDGKATNDILSL